MPKEDSTKKIKDIITKRLFKVSPEIRESFPRVLSEPKMHSFTSLTDLCFILTFGDNDEKERIEKLSERNYFFLPGLITNNNNDKAAFRLENAVNTFIKDCTVDNMYSISLGGDSTIILTNHTQTIRTVELQEYQYVVPLGYIISFGNKINKDNLFNYLDDLVAYSVKIWRGFNAK